MSAIRNGKMAMAIGFHVTIQEIPSSKGKNDPDSYITSMYVLNSLIKKDFVLWYAEKLFANAATDVVKRAKAIHDIVDIVKSTKDNVLMEAYEERLAEVYGHGNMWRRELLGKRPQVLVPCEKMSHDEYVSLFKDSEIKVGKNYYYCLCKDGETDISNFIMIPLYLIREGATATRVFILRNVMGHEVRIEFSIEEMIVLQKFRNRIEREVNFMWYGTSAKFNKLRGILYSNMEAITKISTLGWQRQGFYAFSNGVVLDGEWFPVDEEGIVRLDSSLGSFYLPAFSKMNEDNADKYMFEQKFIHHADSKVRFYAFANQMFDVYGDNAIIGICFIIVCLFRDIIIRYRREFPSLFLFGPKGTGKTAFGELLQSPFVYGGDHPNLRTSTMPSLAIVLSQAENAMMHLNEYKNDIDVEKIELLKGLWDCQGRSKLDMETHKREQSKVLSGVIVSGQEKPTVDIALYSRQCVLPFHKAFIGMNTLPEDEPVETAHSILKIWGDALSRITAPSSSEPPSLMAWLKYKWQQVKVFLRNRKAISYTLLLIGGLTAMICLSLYQSAVMDIDRTNRIFYRYVIRGKEGAKDYHGLDSLIHSEDFFKTYRTLEH